MKQYQEYSTYLNLLVKDAMNGLFDEELSVSIEQALDGQPASELHRLVSIDEIRDAGAFFTGSTLAQNVLEEFVETIDVNSVVYDPACGVGDLLLICAQKILLNAGGCSCSAIALLEERVFGRDLFQEFTDAAKSRLILAAIIRSKTIEDGKTLSLQQRFPHIKIGCGLEDEEPFLHATHIVTNPPFVSVTKPEECSWWGTGKVNQAAVFLANCLDKASLGTRIVAILPDVLRSGPNYLRWREYVASLAEIVNVKLHGNFSKAAQIDVFSIELIAGAGVEQEDVDWGYPEDQSLKTIKDQFEIRTGPVVDFRSPHEGESHPFIQVKGLAVWEEITEIETRRKFTGKVFKPPFVAVRRNSRKHDKYRAVGTIINSKDPVAVENHLIVLKPKDGTLDSCERLLTNLKEKRTNEWFDKRICCRHLTISALKDLPLWD